MTTSLKEALVCTVCHADLAWEAERVRCSRCPQIFPLSAGVPVMLDGSENLHDGFGHDLNQAKESGNFFEKVFHRNRVRTVVRWLQEGPGFQGRVLDLGCNTGPVLIPLRSRGLDVIGLDVIAEDVHVCAGNLKRHGLVADGLVVADGRKTPFPDGFFDGVLLVDVLEHTLDPAGILSEARRVVRQGGYVFASVPWKWHPVVRHDWIRKALTRRKTVDEHPDIPFDNKKLDELFTGWTLERRGLVYQWVCIGAIYRKP